MNIVRKIPEIGKWLTFEEPVMISPGIPPTPILHCSKHLLGGLRARFRRVFTLLAMNETSRPWGIVPPTILVSLRA